MSVLMIPFQGSAANVTTMAPRQRSKPVRLR